MTITTAALNQIVRNLNNFAHIPVYFNRRAEVARYMGTIRDLVNDTNLTDNMECLICLASVIVESYVQEHACNHLCVSAESFTIKSSNADDKFWISINKRREFLRAERERAETQLKNLLSPLQGAVE
jgi:hypothetical protein